MDKEEVKELLNADYGYGSTPLMQASSHQKLELVKRLIDAGADVTRHDKFGQTALSEAITGSDNDEGTDEHIKLEIVRMLIKAGANVNQQYFRGMTPLISATIGGYLTIIEELINEGALVDQHSVNGLTPLLWAMSVGNLHIIQTLLDAGANVNHQESSGDTALLETMKKIRYYSQQTFKEAYEQKIEIIDLLIKHGANPNVKDKLGNTPLMIAATKNQKKIIQKLLDCGADPKIKNGNNDFYDVLKYKKTKDWVFKYVDGFEAYKVGV